MAKNGPKGLSASAAGGKKKKKAFGGKGSDEASNGGGGGGLGVSKGSPAFSAPRTSVRATTHKGRRVLAARESQLVEELKNTLLLFGKRTSQLVKVRLVEADGGGGHSFFFFFPLRSTAARFLSFSQPSPSSSFFLSKQKTHPLIQDVMADLGTLKRGECLKLTRKNDDVLPFEAEGAARLEALARKADAGLFVVGSHSKKRPHTLTLGRVFDGRLLDALELHLSSEEDGCKLLRQYGSAPTAVAAGHKPCLFFAGGAFESDPAMAAARSLLLDLFRGRVVSKINLAGIDRVLVVAAASSSSDGSGSSNGAAAGLNGSSGSNNDKRELSIRQYAVALKKSGTRVPRVELAEVGPSLRASLGRHRQAPPDLWKAAMKQPEGVEKKKVRGRERRERESWRREREKKKQKNPEKEGESAVTIQLILLYF